MRLYIRFTFITLFTLMLTGVFAQESGEITVPFSSPDSPGKIKVDIKKGSIEIRGTARKDVLVKYAAMDALQKEGQTKDGLTRIGGAALDLEATERDNYIEIESNSWNKGVNLVIEVPSDVDLDVATYNSGDIYIENINGEIVSDNYNGRITAENISGSLVADSYNGSILATFKAVTPETPMAFSTYNGHVDLTFPASFKADMKMKTRQGEILSGFKFVLLKNTPTQKNESNSGTYKVKLDDWVRAKINGGGPEITIKNYNGNIYLRKG